jgi:hypothetical protein
MSRPLESERDALSLPQVRAACEAPDEITRRDRNRAMLASACQGIPLGAYGERILLDWLPQWEPQVCAAVAYALRLAREAGPAQGSEEGEADG